MSKRVHLILLIVWGISLALTLIPNKTVQSQDQSWLSSPVANASRCGYPWGGINPAGGQAFHNAVDLACGRDGADVMSVADGEVVYVGWWPKWTKAGGNGHGNIVSVYHPSSGVYTYYAHLKDFTVNVGDKVERGDTIGHVGQTGYANNNSHLHFSVATKDPNSMEAANCWTVACWPNPDNYLGKATSNSNDSQGNSSQQEASQQETALQEQSAPPAPEAPKAEPKTDASYVAYVPEGYTLEAGLVTKKLDLNINFLDKIIIDFAPFKSIIILVLALLAIFWVGGMLYSTQFRRSMTVFAVLAAIVIACFIGVNQVKAVSPIFSAPRNASYVVDNVLAGEYVVSMPEQKPTEPPKEAAAQPEERSAPVPEEKAQPSSDGCSLPSSYPEKILRWCSFIEKWADKRNMDSRWIAAVMLQESGGDPEILSGSGAVGLLQVMPRDGISATFHNAQGVPFFSDRPSIAELKDPEFNIEYGSGMLSKMGINDNPREALLHYGPDPDDLQKVYGSRYYYADLIMSIYKNHQ